MFFRYFAAALTSKSHGVSAEAQSRSWQIYMSRVESHQTQIHTASLHQMCHPVECRDLVKLVFSTRACCGCFNTCHFRHLEKKKTTQKWEQMKMAKTTAMAAFLEGSSDSNRWVKPSSLTLNHINMDESEPQPLVMSHAGITALTIWI